ncbi:hypothetical protein C2A68_003005 [Salmonella enterica subsp. enterica serovar Typhimurium]|nr:hypothetical protein [Salmonella enterica subsp. enterica serovar Typhimurium]
MEPFHAVVLTVSLFVLTFFNPGANLFVVVQTSLASGRRAAYHLDIFQKPGVNHQRTVRIGVAHHF